MSIIIIIIVNWAFVNGSKSLRAEELDETHYHKFSK